jgi:hypothetical protein
MPDEKPVYEIRPAKVTGRYVIWKNAQPFLSSLGKQYEFRGIANAEAFVNNINK